MKELRTTSENASHRIRDDGVTNLVEYLTISGILLLLMIVLMFSVNDVFMEGPANTLSYHAFTDIGNGISVRIVDLYLIAPYNGTISTHIGIPEDVAGKNYFVEAKNTGKDQIIEVSRGFIYSNISIAGIGATRGVIGNTTGGGWNMIFYNSSGVF